MKVNILKLKGKIVETNTTCEVVADYLGVDRSTFYRRLKTGGTQFTVGEMHKIVEFLSLTSEEVKSIFLG